MKRRNPRTEDDDSEDSIIEQPIFPSVEDDLQMNYEGEVDENDQPHGKGRATFENAPMKYEGSFKHGDFHGYGVLEVMGEAGFKYEGMFENDSFSGTGDLRYADGSSYKGQFKNGAYHGHGILTSVNGSAHEGEFYRGLPRGPGLLKDPETGSLHEGYWYHFSKKNPLYTEEVPKLRRLKRKLIGKRMDYVMSKAARHPKFIQGINEQLDADDDLESLGKMIEEFQAELDGMSDSPERTRRQGLIVEMREQYAEEMAELKEIKAEMERKKKEIPELQQDDQLARLELNLEKWRRGRLEREAEEDAFANQTGYTEEEELDAEAIEEVGTHPDAIEEIWGDSEGLLTGYGRITYGDGTTYQGYWEDLLPAGEGTAMFTNDTQYSGEWLNGKMDGAGVLTYEDGSIYEGDFVKGMRHGAGQLNDKEQGLLAGVWVRDVHASEEQMEEFKKWGEAQGLTKDVTGHQPGDARELEEELDWNIAGMSQLGMSRAAWKARGFDDTVEEEEGEAEDEGEEGDADDEAEYHRSMKRAAGQGLRPGASPITAQKRANQREEIAKAKKGGDPLGGFNARREQLARMKESRRGK